MVQCEVAKRTLNLYSWVPSPLQVRSSLKSPVDLTAESGLNSCLCGVFVLVEISRSRSTDATTVEQILSSARGRPESSHQRRDIFYPL
jgi:hypothetical protein